MTISVELLSYILTGMTAGVLAGLLGVGGGIVVVPALLWLMPDTVIAPDQRMHVAVATSLLIMIPTALSSAWKHFQQLNLDIPILLRLGSGIALGSIAGVLLANQLPRDFLQWLFAAFELVIAWQMLKPQRGIRKESVVAVGRVEMLVVGGGIGGLSSLLGIGGGTMTVPYLNWRGVDMRRAIGTSAACGLVIAVIGASMFALTGPQQQDQSLFGFIYLPAAVAIGLSAMLFARFGAILSQKLSVQLLRKVFGLVLIAVAVKMLW